MYKSVEAARKQTRLASETTWTWNRKVEHSTGNVEGTECTELQHG